MPIPDNAEFCSFWHQARAALEDHMASCRNEEHRCNLRLKCERCGRSDRMTVRYFLGKVLISCCGQIVETIEGPSAK